MNKKSLNERDLRKILSNYNLGNLKNYVKMPKGENINIQIRTNKGKYHVKYFIQENSERKNWVLYELLLTDYLRKKGIKVPNIIKTKNGSFYAKYRGRFCVIYEVIGGSIKYPLNENVVSQIGTFLGKFHKITKEYKCRYRTIRGTFTPRILHRILVKEVLPRYKNEKIKNEIIRRSKFIHKMKYSNLPIGSIHMDIDPQNFIFKNNKLQALIDFGDALQGFLIIDVTRGAYEFCLGSGLNFNFELLKIFIQHYQKYRPLTKAEKNAFSDFLRFTFIWKITDGIRAKKSNSWILKRLNMMNKVPDKFSFI